MRPADIPSDNPSPSVFALFDDLDASSDAPSSRLYTGFVREHRCTDPLTLEATWAAVEADQSGGLHAVLLADYEWGARLQHVPQANPPAALRVLMFRALRRLSCEDVAAWLQAQDAADAQAPGAGLLAWRPSIGRAEFGEAVARIHEAIRAGETYQVNFSFRLDGRMHGSPTALYRRLRQGQPVPYGALIALPVSTPQATRAAQAWVLSCSPELFLRHEAGRLTARPMKGTAPRSGDADADRATARWLQADVKNRAENLMIVDLLRNDIGRIARIGSVKVPALFAVEPHGAVLQMTSTVEAELAAGVGFAQVLRAAFPCGSITGAPKRRTMGLISRLESTPRGLYTGAIGWVDAAPAQGGCGAFCLSVAIRTLELAAVDEQEGLRPARLGIGAGIVIDSEAASEWDECQLKARFATDIGPGFELFETLLLTADGLQNVTQHLQRLAASAQTLGFAFDAEAARCELRSQVAGLPAGVRHRVRLALTAAGALSVSSAPLAPLAVGPVRLILAPHPPRTPAALARHKTSLRADYDAGVREAERQGAFDSLFFTADGRLIEGGRSSVFVRLDGRWWTPPVHDGALPGVMRAQLLTDPHWQAGERTIRRDELAQAQELVVCNALRGVLKARLA
jgi:para-aminobenzoate synthetase / 4-amino-4-deoxychorismate lyase